MILLFIMPVVFLVSAVAIAFDNHDFAYPKPQCSICELKKAYKATLNKDQQACIPESVAALRTEGDRYHPPPVQHHPPVCLLSSRESDRAPPPLS
jgi:hypothetical protein